jgi:hypothetical protein
MDLGSLGWKIHDHLKEHRPKMFHRLKAEGHLEAYVKKMQDNASGQLASLEHQGLFPHEAWEIVKDQVLLPTEVDVPKHGETMHPYRD